MKEQIIAIGGGGFSCWGRYSDETLRLSQYLLDQAEKKCPSICFLPTASADDARYTVHFYTEFTKLSCKASHLSLFSPPTKDIEAFLIEKDVIYVGGGSTKNMLVLWKEWSLDNILKKALENGVVLAGVSAGMNCWYDACVTDSLFGDLTALNCLGFLKGSGCPHYDKEEKRRPSYHALMRSGMIGPGIAVEDYAAVHYVNGEIKQVITTTQSSAYEVSIDGPNVVERRLDSVTL